MAIEIPILDGENWWASEAIDDTDSVIKSLLVLTNVCRNLCIDLGAYSNLHAELSLHNDHHTIDLETDKWLSFCTSLRHTEISEMANEVENMLIAYISKHLNTRS